jgi:hypothetical protein
MPMKKPDIRLPQKRYERLPDPPEEITQDNTETTAPALVRCDITSNPSAGTISVKQSGAADTGKVPDEKKKKGTTGTTKKDNKSRQIASGAKNNTKHPSGKNETSQDTIS